MAVIGGSIESVILDGTRFSVPGDTEAQMKLGGFENEVQVAGDGRVRVTKNRMPPGLDGLSVFVDDSQNDLEFLQALADRNTLFPFAVTYVSGAVYQGIAQITGDLQWSSQTSIATVSLMGEGAFNQQ